MSNETRALYRLSLSTAFMQVQANDRDGAMASLKTAMQAANTSRDARYRRAVFRALSFTRRIPGAMPLAV